MVKINFTIYIICLLLILTCKQDKLDNPNHAGDDSYFERQLIECLTGQSSQCRTISVPIPTPSITVSAGNTQNTITWTSVAGATSYSLYHSTSPIVTKTSGTLISNVTSPYNHYSANGTKYYYVLLATNGNQESALSNEVSATSFCTECRMFVTATTYTADLGKPVGADAKCKADANKPSGASVFKALLWDGVNRTPCISNLCLTSGIAEHTDWVLQPNRRYFRSSDSVTIATTNSEGIWTTQDNDISSGASVILWSGADTGGNWVQRTGTSGLCSTWEGDTGTMGSSAGSNNFRIGTGANGCASFHSFACVEQ